MKTSYLKFAKKIKETIKKINASAEIILFGSHARGDAKKDSDWDVLILLNKPKVTIQDEQLFRHTLYDLELEMDQTISTLVYSRKEWNSKLAVTPLFKKIKLEGICL